MRKQKIHNEYILSSASETILWRAISTAHGLQDWFADKVDITHRHCTFQWGKNETRCANIIEADNGKYIRLQWDDEDEHMCFFELKLSRAELTNDLLLEVTDYVEPGEEEEQKELWDTQIGTLCRVYGA